VARRAAAVSRPESMSSSPTIMAPVLPDGARVELRRKEQPYAPRIGKRLEMIAV